MNEYGMNEFEMIKKADVMRIINEENAVVLNNLKERSTDEVLCAIASQINDLQTTAKSGSRLIDKHAAYTALKHEEETHGLSFSAEAFGKAARIIDQMPIIEAEPVRHGRWIEGTSRGSYSIYCSCCGSHKETICPTDYCPNCGARMDGGAENGNG